MCAWPGQKINAAAESAGRSGSEVRLLAATKMNGPEAVQEAIRAGVDICAENRVQEFLSKNAVNAYAPCCVHFIGHLQKNKDEIHRRRGGADPLGRFSGAGWTRSRAAPSRSASCRMCWLR